jgi:hypothetical protein
MFSKSYPPRNQVISQELEARMAVVLEKNQDLNAKRPQNALFKAFSKPLQISEIHLSHSFHGFIIIACYSPRTL